MEPGHPLLPRDRAASNRRRTRLFLLLFGLAALPSVAYVAQYLMLWGVLILVPIAGRTGLVTFLALDALLVLATMVLALVWMYRSAARIVLRSVKARPPHDGEARELQRALQNMAIASGLPVPALYLVDARAPNLLAIGLSPEDSSVVATTGLLVLLEPRELEGAAAHALAQIANGDTQLDTILAAGVRWLRLPGTLVARAARAVGRTAGHFGLTGWIVLAVAALWLGIPLLASLRWGLEDPELRPWTALATGLNFYVFVGAPLLVAFISRVVARERKHLADAEAIQLTRYPVGLARALAKVDAAGSAYPQAAAETANLHFADPIPGESWLARLFDSHPPAADRVAVISRLGGTVLDVDLREAAAAGAAHGQTPAAEPEATPPGIAIPEGSPSALSLIRLVEAASLLALPEADAAVRSVVAPGTRVTVIGEHPGFLEVVTPQDEFGFITRGTPFEEAEAPLLPGAEPA